MYGALTNLYFRFYDLRLGESTTATGRAILKHQCRKVSEIMDGKYDVDFPLYDTIAAAVEAGYNVEEAAEITLHGPKFNGKHQSEAVVYGDSVAGDTIIETSVGPVTIESMFTHISCEMDGKEYCDLPDMQALTYDVSCDVTRFGRVKYVMRHRTSKQMYRVWITNAIYVDVTEDHALIAYNNTTRKKGESVLREVTPVDAAQQPTSLIYQKRLPRTDKDASPPIEGVTAELLQLMGYVMGDGYVDHTKTGGTLLSIGSVDLSEVEDKLLVPLREQGWISSWCVKPNGHDVQISSSKLRKLLRAELYANGTAKATPLWMFAVSEHDIGQYLRGWFSADGWVNSNNVVGITNIHESNIRDIHRLLLLCGVSSTWMTERTPNMWKGNPTGSYSKRLTVRSRDVFARTVGFILDRKQVTCVNVIRYDFSLATPTKIEKLPIQDQYVYDIEVDDTHVFFANGILVHNTDSCYFNTFAPDVPTACRIADYVSDQINKSFPAFMRKAFKCGPTYDDIMQVNREIVSDRGIFVDKKRYIIHIVDSEGETVDKMKIMGLDTKKTTLPAAVSAKLNGFIERLLKDESWDVISQSIVDYKDELASSENILDIGLPRGINKVEEYTQAYKAQGAAARLPGHVAAAIHYNQCLELYQDMSSPAIMSGMKVKVFYLVGSYGKFKSIALPTDIEEIPQWFVDEFKIDIDAHILRLVDNPLTNILKAIGKQTPTRKSILIESAWEY